MLDLKNYRCVCRSYYKTYTVLQIYKLHTILMEVRREHQISAICTEASQDIQCL